MSEQRAQGLTESEASLRLSQYGPNVLPRPNDPPWPVVLARQFLSPLIYILLAAALVSLLLGEAKDAAFIGGVLLLNGLIGAFQEYSAGRAAAQLRQLQQLYAVVLRNGTRRKVVSEGLVPGDVIFLSGGDKVPADLRIEHSEGLRCDESLLTGESRAVAKTAGFPESAHGHAFAGTIVVRGTGEGIVVATGKRTELGKIADQLGRRSLLRPPLMVRLEGLSRSIAVAVGASILLLTVAGLMRGVEVQQLFFIAVGLAVSAIPEGLPVAISVALAISMRRMARRGVIARNMTAVESLGSCSMIATDKTGTLTLNELAVTDVVLPDGTEFIFEPGDDLEAAEVRPGPDWANASPALAERVLTAAALPNEASLMREERNWKGVGDTVDIALLAAAHKGGFPHDALRKKYPLLARIPYEPERKYAASLHRDRDGARIFIKGAPDTLLDLVDRMDAGGVDQPIDRALVVAQTERLTKRGLRVLAVAEASIASVPDGKFANHHLEGLVLLGLVGMQDPIRPEVPQAIAACRKAQIDVAMITGDDPRTALAIAHQAGLEIGGEQVATGEEVRHAEEAGENFIDALTRRARLYARVQPAQKLAIVLSMARNGHFVAVTGDGVNDAPALKHAHVGVAMGRKGTDVAKESAGIIITDDNFASIVEGVREGRVAYANIRKVVFMSVSTGAAEVVLFLLSIPLGFPMPLLAVQLLWLNLVTNGIQDVFLATEKAEGDELTRPPRRPGEPIFDSIMLRRIALSAVLMGGGGFILFAWMLSNGYDVASARNLLLVLFVLFENVQTMNSRSDHLSIFKQPMSANPQLVFGVALTTAIQVLAAFVPWTADVLGLLPPSSSEWGGLLVLALSLLVLVEADKWLLRRRGR